MKRTIKITEEQLDMLNELLDTTDSSSNTNNSPTVSVETAEPRHFDSATSDAVRKQIETGNNVTVKSKQLGEGRKKGTKVVKLSQLFK